MVHHPPLQTNTRICLRDRGKIFLYPKKQQQWPPTLLKNLIEWLTFEGWYKLFLSIVSVSFIVSYIDSYLLEILILKLQAVIKQFSATGYESSDVMVIDEMEMQLHHQLDKLYKSTREKRVRVLSHNVNKSMLVPTVFFRILECLIFCHLLSNYEIYYSIFLTAIYLLAE